MYVLCWRRRIGVVVLWSAPLFLNTQADSRICDCRCGRCGVRGVCVCVCVRFALGLTMRPTWQGDNVHWRQRNLSPCFYVVCVFRILILSGIDDTFFCQSGVFVELFTIA